MGMNILNARNLLHGGIMVNYRCNAACRHCLYSCSPTREAGYVDADTAKKICALLRKGSCASVHIGGGEPFLDFEGLLMVIRTLKETGITLDYIETNAQWAIGTSALKETRRKLECLLKEGANTLCISVDPYHAEYIPYGTPLALADLCEKTGMNYFLWKRQFLPALSRLDPQKAHLRTEMEKVFSRDYIHNTARLYGIGYGGRAINIEREFGTLSPVESLTGKDTPCRNLLSTGHFHVDMLGYFIPPRCTGIRVPLSEVVSGIPEGKYPVFGALYSSGVSTLLELARQQGFTPNLEGYPSKCGLCFHLRHFLSDKDFPELDKNHYEEALKYY